MTICVQSLSGLLVMGHKFNEEIIQEFGGKIEEWAAWKIQVLSLASACPHCCLLPPISASGQPPGFPPSCCPSVLPAAPNLHQPPSPGALMPSLTAASTYCCLLPRIFASPCTCSFSSHRSHTYRYCCVAVDCIQASEALAT